MAIVRVQLLLTLISAWACITLAGAPPPVESVPVFDCAKLKDGYYKDPINNCSKIYFACSGGHPTGGLPIMQRCGEGNLAYDEVPNSCLFRHMVTGCKEFQPGYSTPVYTTKVTPSEAPFICREWGSFAHPDRKCSKSFYICGSDSPYGHLWECPEGTAFDPILKLCLWVDSIPECTGSFRTPAATTAVPSSTTDLPDVSTPDNRPQFNCPSLGNFPDTASNCSHFFYVCTPDSSIGHLFKCPRFTYFDAVKMKCQFFAIVPACSGTPHSSINMTTNSTLWTTMRTNGSSSAVVTSNTTVRSENVTKFNCTGKKDGNYRVGKCARYFYQCAHDEAFLTDCPGDLVYRMDIDECVRPEDCHNKSSVNTTAFGSLNSTQIQMLNGTVSNSTIMLNGTTANTTTLKSTGSSTTTKTTTVLLTNTTIAVNVTMSPNTTSSTVLTTTKSG